MNNYPKISVLIVLYYYHPYVSGLSNYAKSLAEGLVRNGVMVTVLSTRYDRHLPPESEMNGVRVIRIPIAAKFGKGVIAPSFWFAIASLAKKYDIVNFHLPLADAGMAGIFIDRKKIITTYHCDLNLGKGLAQTIVQRLSYMLMKVVLYRSSRIVVNSLDYFSHSTMKKYLQKAVEIYPPIQFSQYYRVPYNELLDRLGIRSETYKIGFVGRLVHEKGIEYLLDAIPSLENKMKDFVIVIAGEIEKVAGGTILNRLANHMQRHKKHIIITGFLNHEDLLRFYSMIDVLVLPSIDPLESFGMVQIEAMLCGTPVVASDLPGVRTVVQETGYGALCKPGYPSDIAQQIIKVKEGKISLDTSKLQKFNSILSIDKYQKLFTSSSAPHA